MPRHAAEGGAHGEGQQLHVAGVDAHGLGGDLVLADGHPGAADARILQAVADDDAEQHQHQEQVVVQRDRVDVEAETLQALAQVQKPKTLTESIWPMPLGPLVRLTGWSRLFRKMRMISPKPSVTMAR
jgi:hypothetical protein